MASTNKGGGEKRLFPLDDAVCLVSKSTVWLLYVYVVFAVLGSVVVHDTYDFVRAVDMIRKGGDG